MVSGVLKSVADPDEIPRPVEGVDVTRFDLTAEEGFVYSRIDGHTPVRSLPMMTALPEASVARALQRLRVLGAVVLSTVGGNGTSQSAARPRKQDEPFEGMVFNLVDLAEQVDLAEEQKKRILFVEAKLTSWNHFELLGLGRGSTQADVRKAYFKASKEFHPDAYFRKNLGSYGHRIETIFKAMKISYDLLSNDETREAYEKSIVWTMTPEEERVIVDKVKRKAREGRREILLRERRLKNNPMVERIKRANVLYQAGIEAIRAEKWIEAANHLRLAITFHPMHRPYHELYSEASSRAKHIRAQNIVRTMNALLEAGENDALIELIDELMHVGEDRADLLAEGAEIVLRSGAVRRAFELAQRAVATREHDKHALLALAHAAERAEKWSVATRSVEKLLVQDASNGSYKDWLKKLRKHL
ncbi:MAG: J domain-containing protein [Pseudomonadota bacterium]